MDSGTKSFLTNYGLYILLFVLAAVALGISIGAFTKKCDKFEAFGAMDGAYCNAGEYLVDSNPVSCVKCDNTSYQPNDYYSGYSCAACPGSLMSHWGSATGSKSLSDCCEHLTCCGGAWYNGNCAYPSKNSNSYPHSGHDWVGDCDPGKYYDNTEAPQWYGGPGSETSATCIDCPAGSYCPGGLAISSGDQPSHSVATTCPAGNYCPAGSSTYTQCPTGTYCPAGSSTYTSCPGGRYCPYGQAGDTPTICPGGHYCPEGSSAPGPTCPTGHYCPDGSSSAGPACPPGTYCPAKAAGSVGCDSGYSCPWSGMSSVGPICPPSYTCPEGTVQPGYCAFDTSPGAPVNAWNQATNSYSWSNAQAAASRCPGEGNSIVLIASDYWAENY